VLLEPPEGTLAPVPEGPLPPVTPVSLLLPGPPLGTLLVLPLVPVLLPLLPVPELVLEPLLLFCCRHFCRSEPVRPVHWVDDPVLAPALPPVPDVPLLLPELMPDGELVLPEFVPDGELVLLSFDCAHETAATLTSAAATAALIAVFTMIRSSQLNGKSLRPLRCKRDARTGRHYKRKPVPRQRNRSCRREKAAGPPSGRCGPPSRAPSGRLWDRPAPRAPAR
jgi:hypothetical protein